MELVLCMSFRTVRVHQYQIAAHTAAGKSILAESEVKPTRVSYRQSYCRTGTQGIGSCVRKARHSMSMTEQNEAGDDGRVTSTLSPSSTAIRLHKTVFIRATRVP
jgi:hypothetical protein